VRTRAIGGINYKNLVAPPFEVGINTLLRITSVKRSSEFILMADSTADGTRDAGIFPYHQSAARNDVIGNIHSGGPNILFLDGHVQWYAHKDVTTQYPPVPEESAKQRMWNADGEPSQPW
jgi:prepilin-type processing-associated H-X9-DG protein